MAVFLSQYEKKLSSHENALNLINDNDKILVPIGCGEPVGLMEYIGKNFEKFKGVTIHQMLPLNTWTYLHEDYEHKENITHYSWFIGGASRKTVNKGISESVPNYFSESPRLVTEYLKPDVVTAAVSPMDKHGYMSLGVAVDYTLEAMKKADKVIVEVNKYMPRTLGNCFIHISEVDCVLENHTPLTEINNKEIGDSENKIGELVADLIEDGSTIQIGIGSIPDALTKFLMEKRNLGIHSEMLTDGMVDLVLKGAVNNSMKKIHKGKIVGTFAFGTKRLYEFLDDNPIVEMHPVSYTNDPYIISQNYKMVAINSALEIDLTGQVAAESIGNYQFSGTGGQMDFMRGANLCEDGKAIVALTSTAKNGSLSRIVSSLTPGAVVTTPRTEVEYVVTEYGVVNLKGKSLRERAKKLISIAHPKFREELTKEAEKLNIL